MQSGGSAGVSREAYRELIAHGLEGLVVGHLLVDPDGRILGMNLAASELLGLDRSKVTGTRVQEHVETLHDIHGEPIPPDDRPLVQCISKQRPTRTRLIAYRVGDREEKTWVEISATPLVDADGVFWAALAVFFDATERVAIEAHQHILASIVEATDNGVAVTDLDRKIEWANPAFSDITGYALEEVVGRKPSDAFQCEETDPATVARMRYHLDRGEGFHEEVLNRRKDGERCWVDLEVQPLHDHLGVHRHWVGLKRDITARRAVDAELRRMTQRANAHLQALEIALERAERLRREAQAAERAKDQFLRTASHELRTPLHGMMVAADLLRDQVDGEEERDLARLVVESGERLLRLVDNVMCYTRLASDHVARDPRSISLASLLSALRGIYEPQAERRDVVFSVEAPHDLPSVQCDQALLWRVLCNLLDNAIDIVGRGEVRLTLAVDDVGDRVRLVFRVIDTGPGIPADRIGTIFEPFVQVDPSTTRTHEGLGLGLAIARESAEKLGGRLTVSTAPDAPTVFAFEIDVPRDLSAASDRVRTGEQIEPVMRRLADRTPRILVVGEEHESDSLARGSFRSLGVTVEMPVVDTELDPAALAEHYDVLWIADPRDTRESELRRAFAAAGKACVMIGIDDDASTGPRDAPGKVVTLREGFDFADLVGALGRALDLIDSDDGD